MDIQQVLSLLIENDEPVPKPIRLPTKDEVVAAEDDLSFKFPDQYNEFMLQASNVTYGVREPGLVLQDLPPYCCLRTMAKDGWDAGVPKDFLAFCEDNGNYFTINEAGELGYYDHDGSSHMLIAGDLKDWIYEDWLNLE